MGRTPSSREPGQPSLLPGLLAIIAVGLTLATGFLPASASRAETPNPAKAPLENPERFLPLFRPLQTENATLSPDGRFLAYTHRRESEVSVVVVETKEIGKIVSRLPVVTDEGATAMLSSQQYEKTPGRVAWMGWVSPSRLVVHTNQTSTRADGPDSEWQSWSGLLIGTDADGSNIKVLLRPEDVAEFNAATGNTPDPFALNHGHKSSRARASSADLPSSAAEASIFDPPSVDNTSLADSTGSPTIIGTSARSFEVLGPDFDRPGNIRVIASGPARSSGVRRIGLYSVNGTSGKLIHLNDQNVAVVREALLDRHGNVRVDFPKTSAGGFPLRYRYMGTSFASRYRPLDDVITLSAPQAFSVSPENFFAHRAIPLGFGENPNILYFASNVGRETLGVYGFDLASGKAASISMENPGFDLTSMPRTGFPNDNPLVFSRLNGDLAGVRYQARLGTVAWLQPDLREVQAELEKALPGRSVEILEWDSARKQFLVAAEGPADSGGYFLFSKENKKLIEFARRAPWMDESHTPATFAFSLDGPAGNRLNGLATVPRTPRMKPIPVVVLCRPAPWERVSPGFQTQVAALTEMGFVVLQINGRGAWGNGVGNRDRIHDGYDLAQIDDIVFTLKKLEAVFSINLQRVALLGQGHGGFIALRALQDHPALFRCAIAIDPVIDLGSWLAAKDWEEDDVFPRLAMGALGNKARFAAAPLIRRPQEITRPVLILSYPGVDGEPRLKGYLETRRFTDALEAGPAEVSFVDLSMDFMRGLPAARSKVFAQIEDFLNLNIYSYSVDVRDTTVVHE
jgi:pimeloyl-ACP methyl ester carboxylesterase